MTLFMIKNPKFSSKKNFARKTKCRIASFKKYFKLKFLWSPESSKNGFMDVVNCTKKDEKGGKKLFVTSFMNDPKSSLFKLDLKSSIFDVTFENRGVKHFCESYV